MAKKVKLNKTSNKEKATDKFLRFMFLINNKSRFGYKGDNSLWYALISFNKYNRSSLREYIKQMKKYDHNIGNHKRISEFEEIEHLSDKEILDYGQRKYDEFWKKINKEIDKESQIKNQRIGEI